LAGILVRPAVIPAPEMLLVAALDLADQRAAVTAAIHQDANDAVFPSNQDDRLASHRPQNEIAGLGDFALMAHVEPRRVKDLLELLLENFGLRVNVAVNAARPNQRRDGIGAVGPAGEIFDHRSGLSERATLRLPSRSGSPEAARPRCALRPPPRGSRPRRR